MKSFKAHLTEASITMGRALVDELEVLEADTVDSSSPKEKQQLADALETVKKRGTQWAMTTTPAINKYLKNKALPNLIDIAKDNNNNRLVKSATTLMNKL